MAANVSTTSILAPTYVFCQLLCIAIILNTLCVLQRFIIMLSNHIANSETHGQEVNTLWFKWALDRLRQVFLQVSSQLAYRYIERVMALSRPVYQVIGHLQ